jgi:hypothetical protein
VIQIPVAFRVNGHVTVFHTICGLPLRKKEKPQVGGGDRWRSLWNPLNGPRLNARRTRARRRWWPDLGASSPRGAGAAYYVESPASEPIMASIGEKFLQECRNRTGSIVIVLPDATHGGGRRCDLLRTFLWQRGERGHPDLFRSIGEGHPRRAA